MRWFGWLRRKQQQLSTGELHLGANINPVSGTRRYSPDELMRRYVRWVYRAITLNAKTAAAVQPRLFAVGDSPETAKALLRCGCYGARPLSAKTKDLIYGRAGLELSNSAKAALYGREQDLVELTDHAILRLLNDVNPWDEGFSYREQIYTDLGVFGEHYSHLIPAKPPRQLWRLRPTDMKIIRDERVFISGYEQRVGAETRRLDVDEVLWIRLPDPDDPWGAYGPLEAWITEVDADLAVADFQQWIFQRGGTPDLAVIAKQPMSAPQREEFRKEWRRRFGNYRDRLRDSIAILWGDAEVKSLATTPRELEFKASRDSLRDSITQGVGGVPKALITADDVNLANAREGSPTHLRNEIWPLICRVEDCLNQRLVPRWPGRLVIVHDNPLPREREQIRIEAESKLRSGYSVDEVRAMWGDEPLGTPESQTPLIASGLVPLERVDEPPPSLFGPPPDRDDDDGDRDEADDERDEQAEDRDDEEREELSLRPLRRQLEEPEPQIVMARRATANGHAERIPPHLERFAAVNELVRDVQLGHLPRDSAVAQIGELLGLGQDMAERLVGSAGVAIVPAGKQAGRGQDGAKTVATAQDPISRPAGPTSPGTKCTHKADQPVGDPAQAEEHFSGSQNPAFERAIARTMRRLIRQVADEVARTKDTALYRGCYLSATGKQDLERLLKDAAGDQIMAWLSRGELDRWLQEIAKTAAPHLEAIYDGNGQAALDAVGAGDLRFSIDAEPTVRALEQAAARLANSSVATLREEIARALQEGLEARESVQQIAVRVRALEGADFTSYAAERIARTETAISMTDATREGWRQSGVVVGYRFVLAPDACEWCQAVADQYGGKTFGLDEPLLPVGSTLAATVQGADGTAAVRRREISYAPIYSTVHPQCRCTIDPVMN